VLFTLDELHSFVVFSELLNFTRAAEVLNISQPALHTKINKLADGLGVPLYQRIGRRLELTPAGVDAARFGREMSERTNAFTRELRQGTSRSAVVLAAGEGAFMYLLDAPIRSFLRASEAPLRLLTRDWDGILGDVRAGRAHLGVTVLDAPVEGLERRILARVGQVLAMPRSHRLARRKQVQMAELQGLRLVVPPADRPMRANLGRALQSAGIDWEPAVEATGWPLMTHFVSLGLGLAIVNEFCRLPPSVVARPIVDLPRVHYYLVRRAGSRFSDDVARLESTLNDSLASFRGAAGRA
jgi:LysR family transcriptional regulator, low CO2-responsive transcriptional regulator